MLVIFFAESFLGICIDCHSPDLLSGESTIKVADFETARRKRKVSRWLSCKEIQSFRPGGDTVCQDESQLRMDKIKPRCGEKMARSTFIHVPYTFCYGACQPSSGVCFKIAKDVWVKVQDTICKTPYVIAWWMAGVRKPHPVWVRWEKQSVEKDEWLGNAKAYARTMATALLYGESVPRRFRITFYWRYQTDPSGRPSVQETHGGTWVVADLGPDVCHSEERDGRTFPLWGEEGAPQWAEEYPAVVA